MKPLDFRTSSYFSIPLRFGGGVLFVAGAVIVPVNVYIGLAAVMAGVLMLTTHYRLTVDLANRAYHDYIWILGLKSGDRGEFDRIEYIFINRNRVTETMHSRGSSSTRVRDDYNGYLKLSERKKIHLASNEDKEPLVNGMREIARQLNCDVMDYTE